MSTTSISRGGRDQLGIHCFHLLRTQTQTQMQFWGVIDKQPLENERFMIYDLRQFLSRSKAWDMENYCSHLLCGTHPSIYWCNPRFDNTFIFICLCSKFQYLLMRFGIEITKKKGPFTKPGGVFHLIVSYFLRWWILVIRSATQYLVRGL